MIVYPAIDIRDGRCVRLLRGDYDQETVYGQDPVAVARSLLEEVASAKLGRSSRGDDERP